MAIHIPADTENEIGPGSRSEGCQGGAPPIQKSRMMSTSQHGDASMTRAGALMARTVRKRHTNFSPSPPDTWMLDATGGECYYQKAVLDY
jgi:hypothetical protein